MRITTLIKAFASNPLFASKALCYAGSHTLVRTFCLSHGTQIAYRHYATARDYDLICKNVDGVETHGNISDERLFLNEDNESEQQRLTQVASIKALQDWIENLRSCYSEESSWLQYRKQRNHESCKSLANLSDGARYEELKREVVELEAWIEKRELMLGDFIQRAENLVGLCDDFLINDERNPEEFIKKAKEELFEFTILLEKCDTFLHVAAQKEVNGSPMLDERSQAEQQRLAQVSNITVLQSWVKSIKLSYDDEFSWIQYHKQQNDEFHKLFADLPDGTRCEDIKNQINEFEAWIEEREPILEDFMQRTENLMRLCDEFLMNDGINSEKIIEKTKEALFALTISSATCSTSPYEPA